MSLHQRIKALRVDSGMTQQELSNKLGISRSTVANWETEATPNPPSLKALAQLFNVSVDYILYGGEGNKEMIPDHEILILVDDGAGGHKIADLTGLPIEEQKLIWDIIEKFKKDKNKHQK
jgi:transcriptional regulator with XRE-family HTH domain